MRKSHPLMAALAAALMLSCAKEERPAARLFSLDATMPEAETKTALSPRSGEVYPVLWSVGDFLVVNGVPSRPLTLAEAGNRTARFYFPEGVTAPYRVEYGDGIPSVQAYHEGNIGSGCAPMAAESAEPSVTLKHLSCILSFTLSGPVTVAGLSLRSLDGTALSSGPDIEMTVPPGGVSLEDGKKFCFAVRPGTLAKGLTLDVFATDGRRMQLTALIGKRLSAGRLYTLPAAKFEANADPVTLIGSYSELKAFAARVAAGEKALAARLTADIAADGSWTPIEGLKGEIDGGGYQVTGLRRALVQELTGCIRNLTVEGNITISGQDDIAGDASQYWAGILANRLYTAALIENCTVTGTLTYNQWGKIAAAGGVAGYASRGTVRHTVSRAAITVNGDGAAAIHAGGIIGYTYSSSEAVSLQQCRNEGRVLVRGDIKSANLGGIVGNMAADHTSTLTGNVNKGDVAVDAGATVSGILNLGGIAGSSQDVLQNCIHAGTIRQSAATASVQNIGGIAGSVIAESVTGCTNEGSILLDGAGASAAVRCGGILGFASGDTAVSSMAVGACTFSGAITVDIPSHAAVYAKPVTGLYSLTHFTETDCENRGKIEVK